MNEPLDYLREPPPRTTGRPISKWLALLLIWTVGLCIWAGYIAVLFVGFLKVFTL